jgi:hypothetical protein
MKPTLNALIARARGIRMTPEQAAAQRRSFVYGNCNIDNARVTREMVDEADGNVIAAMPGVPG